MDPLPHEAVKRAPHSLSLRAKLVEEMIHLPDEEIIPAVERVLSADFPYISSADRAAVLAVARQAVLDMQGKIYHCPQHALHVAIATRILAKDALGIVDSRLELLLFIAALGHDIDWSVMDVRPTDIFHLERRAAAQTSAILLQHGFPEDERALVEALILSTSPLCRRDIMRLADAAEWRCLDLLRQAGIIPGELERLTTRSEYATMAGILSDADLFFSVALGDRAYAEMTSRVAKEHAEHADLPFHGVDPEREQEFFRSICRDGFASRGGVQFADSLEALWGRSVGTPLTIRSASLSKRLRNWSPAEREFARECLFRHLGGWRGYRDALRMETSGHVVMMAEDRRALVVTRGGLFLVGRVEDAGIAVIDFEVSGRTE